jgi:transcription elongation factor GreA
MDNSKTYLLTPEGKANLEQELVDLRAKRQEALVELQRARSMGDLRENSAYQAARERLGNIDRRIIKVELTLRHSQTIAKNNGDNVQIGSQVKLLVNGQTIIYEIVGDAEMDLKQKKISFNSPLAKAMLGKKKNDTIKVMTPSGSQEYQIIKID